MNKYSSVWVALLGVVVGALAVLTYGKWQESRRLIRTETRDWRKLNLVLQSLDRNYVDTVDREAVTEAAISAALGALDPHSVYMPPAVLEETEADLAGNFDGIGIQFNVPNDTAIVLEVISGGPSEKIGLQPGDRILEVDDRNIAGVKFPQDSMVRRMRGPSGTKVRLTVLRDGTRVPFEITRGRIPLNSVDAAFMVDDTTAYLRLGKFSRTTYQEVSAAASRLLGQGMRRMVLDLRDNGGGFFDQALYLCDLFLPGNAEIVYLEGRNRARQDYRASGKGILQDVSLAVLINENSASSSEIFAGAIQDNDRGTVYGRRSFGKGLVQEPLYFTDGSGLRLTVARYHTPSGRCIQKPYSVADGQYDYDIYYRYRDGEMTNADSVKVDRTEEYHTLGGRTVYGGGGIVPDVFVPIDTTKVSRFYMDCSKKATAMRFASAYFDSHRAELLSIDNYATLERYLASAGLERGFLEFAATKDGLRPVSAREWAVERPYMMASLRALVGRYSKLGDEAFYHMVLTTDNVFAAAMGGSQ